VSLNYSECCTSVKDYGRDAGLNNLTESIMIRQNNDSRSSTSGDTGGEKGPFPTTLPQRGSSFYLSRIGPMIYFEHTKLIMRGRIIILKVPTLEEGTAEQETKQIDLDWTGRWCSDWREREILRRMLRL